MRKKCIYPLRAIQDKIERFNKYIFPEPNTGCWLWGGAITGAGYGLFNLGRRTDKRVLAHRFSYELFSGKLLVDKQVLRHSCDNTFCVNPDHLLPGTYSDNMQDMVRRGRKVMPFGIPFETIQEIRRVFNPENPDYVSLSQKYNVTQCHIHNIIKNKYRKTK